MVNLAAMLVVACLRWRSIVQHVQVAHPTFYTTVFHLFGDDDVSIVPCIVALFWFCAQLVACQVCCMVLLLSVDTVSRCSY